MNTRQRRIMRELYDDLQSYRFVKLSDPAAEEKLVRLIKKIDKLVEKELATKVEVANNGAL